MHPSKFQWVSRYGFVTAATSFSGGQPHFVRCMAVSWAGSRYMHFRGLPLDGISPRANSLCAQVLRSPILAALLHSLESWSSAKLCGVQQRASPIFGRATITLGIGSHSSFISFSILKFSVSISLSLLILPLSQRGVKYYITHGIFNQQYLITVYNIISCCVSYSKLTKQVFICTHVCTIS